MSSRHFIIDGIERKNCSNSNCSRENPQPVENFGVYRSQKDGLHHMCRECSNASRCRSYYKNPQKSHEATKKWKKSNPGKAQKIKKREYDKNKEKYSKRAKEYREKYQEEISQKKKDHYEANKEIVKAKVRKYASNNKQKVSESKKKSYKKNKDKYKERRKRDAAKINARNAKRHASKLQRTPPWLTKEQLKEIQDFYELAKELQWLSERPLHVDHIVPMQGENVSGLHVPWNLQILPEPMNCSKHNKFG